MKNIYHKIYRDCPPALLAITLHVAIFASLSSFSAISVNVSKQSLIGSFSVMSVSGSGHGSSSYKSLKKKEEYGDSVGYIKDGKDNSLDLSSEVLYEADNLNNPRPQYPILSKRRGEEGTVLIRAFIDRGGIATKIEIFKSSSFSLLDNAALEAVKKWQFIPAKSFGQYISSFVIVPVTFKLSQTHES